MAGKYFEEFVVGEVFKHDVRRTITEYDNVMFSTMTMNPAAIHIDEEYCRTETEFGQRIVNSILTLGIMVGIAVYDTTLGTTVANLGWEKVTFPKPLFHGDTIHAETEILAVRDSKSRPDNGIVTFLHRAYNQHNVLVAECTRAGLMKRKP